MLLLQDKQILSDKVSALIEQKPEYISVDTEFVRRTTYFPKLGLIQIGCLREVLLIDPLTCDFDVLKPLLFHESIIKVFHSAKQDLEIFYNIYREIPNNLYDLQIAVHYLGLGGQISLEGLANELMGIELNKESQNKNWLERPLSQSMLDYAEKDARTIYDLYPLVIKELELVGRKDWPCMESLYLWPQDLSQKFFKKAIFYFRTDHDIKTYFALSRWREDKAISFDCPRGHVLADPALLEITKQKPATMADLKKILYQGDPKKMSDAVLRDEFLAFFENLDLDSIELPKIKEYACAQNIADLLNAISAELNLPSSLILSKNEVHLLSKDFDYVKNLPKWKQELISKYLTASVLD